MFIGIASVVVLVIVAVVLIVTLTRGKSGPIGAFSCTAPGQATTGVVTFTKSVYSLDHGGTGGSYVRDGGKLTFKDGDLDGIVASYDSGAKTVKFTYRQNALTCKG
jgi:hypothetical protein